MAKSTKQQNEPESEEAIMERVKEGFKRLLNTPPETHKEMVARRRGDSRSIPRKTTPKRK